MELKRERVCILVKAYPQTSKKYIETVCCAAITERGELRRLYPINYRLLEPQQRFKRFDWIEANMERNPLDPRPESYKLDQGSLVIFQRGDKATPESKLQIWKPHVVPSIHWLVDEQERSGRSLGIVQPDPGSVRFGWKSAEKADEQERSLAAGARQQLNIFTSKPLEPLPDPDYIFRYRFTSDGRPHEMALHDWEVQTTFWKYSRQYGGAEAALDKMRQFYEQEAVERNLHLVLGNMHKRRHQFIIVGVLRSSAASRQTGWL